MRSDAGEHRAVVTPEALTVVPFIARASDAAAARLAERASRRSYDRGEFLFRTGEPADRLFLVTAGRIAAIATSEQGTPLLFHVAGVGETPGHVDVLGGHAYSVSAQALSAVQVVVIPARACQELLATEPAAALAYATELSSIVRRLTSSMSDLVFLDLERRLARMLADAPATGDIVSLDMTQSELAARLGAARQSLNQSLSRLAERGLIVLEGPRVIRIVDRDAVAAFVAGELPTLPAGSRDPSTSRQRS